MSGRNAYQFIGILLVVAGIIMAPFSYFVLMSPPLTASGISALMIGITCLTLARVTPSVPSEASSAFFKTAMGNTAALIEELGLTAKAIYLPASLREGTSQAIIPLLSNGVPKFDGKLPGRLIVRYGPNPHDMAIAVSTLGSVYLDNIEVRPEAGGRNIEDALSRILVGRLDLATSVRAAVSDRGVEVEISKPRLQYENIWFYRCLGSPLASIVATVVAEALNKPVIIKSEAMERGKSRIEIEALH